MHPAYSSGKSTTGLPPDNDGFYSIIETNEGLIAAGYASVGLLGKFDEGWLCILNDSGVFVTDTSIGVVNKGHRIRSLTGLSGGGFGLTGYSERNTFDIWVSKFAFQASVSPTSLSSFSVYPNPASDQLRISYQLESFTMVQIELVDILGNIVYVAEESHPSGYYEDILPVSTFTAGPYLLRFKSGSNVVSKPVLISR